MANSSEIQTSSDILGYRNFNNTKSSRTAGSLPTAVTFLETLEPVSPAEHEYNLCQSSPSSDISFGWEEVPVGTRAASNSSSDESDGVHTPIAFASECTNAVKQINVTPQDSNASESECKEERNVGVTTTNKKSNLREDTESTHLAFKNVVPENLRKNYFRMNETRDSVESVIVCHSEELAGKLAKDGCKKKTKRDFMREDCWSDSSGDSVEVTQTNRMTTF
jgi:hypothetical protein